ncbi:MAG: GtrA family protein [Pseudonocardia sp.]
MAALAVRDASSVLPQAARFLLVGAAATALNAVLFYTLRTWWGPVPASAVSLVLSTAFSTEAHRRFTFGATPGRRWRVYAQSVGTIVFYAGYSAAVITGLHAVLAAPTPLHETLAVAAASVLGGASRFLLLRWWVFVPGSEVPNGAWYGTVTAMTRLRRSVLAVLAGAAVLLTSAGACGSGGDDGDDDEGGGPGVTQQDDGDGDD